MTRRSSFAGPDRARPPSPRRRRRKRRHAEEDDAGETEPGEPGDQPTPAEVAAPAADATADADAPTTAGGARRGRRRRRSGGGGGRRPPRASRRRTSRRRLAAPGVPGAARRAVQVARAGQRGRQPALLDPSHDQAHLHGRPLLQPVEGVDPARRRERLRGRDRRDRRRRRRPVRRLRRAGPPPDHVPRRGHRQGRRLVHVVDRGADRREGGRREGPRRRGEGARHRRHRLRVEEQRARQLRARHRRRGEDRRVGDGGKDKK